MRRRKRDATATGRWEGADGGGSGQPGPEGGSHTKHTEQSTHQAAIRYGQPWYTPANAWRRAEG